MDTQKLKQEFGLPAQITLIFVVLAHPVVLEQIGQMFMSIGLLDAKKKETASLHLYMLFAILFFVVIWLLKKNKLLLSCEQEPQPQQ